MDFQGWLQDVAPHRATQRDGLVRELARLHHRRTELEREEELVRVDYMRHLRAGSERAPELATSELDRVASEQREVDAGLGRAG